MKLIALAAALAFGGTAIAQDVPAAQDMPAKQDSQTTTGAGEVQTMDDPKGGYMPTTPMFATPPVPGATIRFVPSTMSPSEAYPAPAPLQRYPVCKKGQFDNCRQRGG